MTMADTLSAPGTLAVLMRFPSEVPLPVKQVECLVQGSV